MTNANLPLDAILAAIKNMRGDRDALSKIQRHAEHYLKQTVTATFRVGSLAVFDVNGVPTCGTVERINRKSLTLKNCFSLDERAHFSEGYRVSPSLLRDASAAESATYRSHKAEEEKRWEKMSGSPLSERLGGRLGSS